jgi:uncharacterized membrane protein YeiB
MERPRHTQFRNTIRSDGKNRIEEVLRSRPSFIAWSALSLMLCGLALPVITALRVGAMHNETRMMTWIAGSIALGLFLCVVGMGLAILAWWRRPRTIAASAILSFAVALFLAMTASAGYIFALM